MIDKHATYWHMLPAYSQGRKAIWTAVNPHTGKRRIDETFPHELRANTNEQEMFIRFKNGATWQVLGSDRYDAAVGSPPYGITFSEWALSNPASRAYLAPIVIENGGWALFITTARGRNHAKSMLDMAETRDDWFSEVLPVNVTGAMSEAAVEQQRVEYTGIFGKEAADALIDQEYTAASRRPFSAPTGARRCSSPSSRAASATCRSTQTCPSKRPGTSASTTPWPSGASRSIPTISTSWTITRVTVRASTTTARGSTSAVITAPTGRPTTRRSARSERRVLGRASRRYSASAASPSWRQSSR
jgi:hypothetical protein